MVDTETQLSSTLLLDVNDDGQVELKETVTGTVEPVTRNREMFNVMLKPRQWRACSTNLRKILEEHQSRLFIQFRDKDIFFTDQNGDVWFKS